MDFLLLYDSEHRLISELIGELMGELIGESDTSRPLDSSPGTASRVAIISSAVSMSREGCRVSNALVTTNTS